MQASFSLYSQIGKSKFEKATFFMHTDEFIEYLKTERNFSQHTVFAYLADLKQFAECIERECGVTEEKDVTASMVRIWLVNLKEHGVSNRSIGRKVASMRTYFNFMAREGFVSQNPMLKIVAPKITLKNPNIVLTDDMEKVLIEKQQDTSFTGVRNSLILELLYATGMRQAELLEVEEDDINYENSEIRIEGKGRKERIVPISRSLLDKIREFIDRKHALNISTPKLLVNRRFGPMTKKQLYTLVSRELAVVTSLEQHSPHVLRHSFASNVLKEGGDLNSVKEILGHSSLASTQVYTHTTIEELKKAYKQAHPRAGEDTNE